MNTFKVKKSKRHINDGDNTFKVKKSKTHISDNDGDEKLFASSSIDNDKVNTSNAIPNDLECTGQSKQESKNVSSKSDSVDPQFRNHSEHLRKRKTLWPKKLIIETGGSENCSQEGLEEGPLLISNVNKCDICDCSFNNTNELAAHKEGHSNSTTPSINLTDPVIKDLQSGAKLPRISPYFKCNICDYESKQRGTFNRHLRVHSEEKRFKCEICEFSTRHKSTLETHKKTHFNIREYECDLCFKLFLTKQNLQAHILIHTGERPHVCDLCNKAFVQMQHLTKHYTRVHMNVI